MISLLKSKRFSILLSSVFLGSAILVGQAVAAAPDASAMNRSHCESMAAASPVKPGNKQYSLDARVEKIDGEYYLKLFTNLKLTDNNYGGAPVAGQGHVHYYLDGQITGPITSKKLFKLTNLHQGTNKIRLVLAENNHVEDFGSEAFEELTVVVG
ncbi:hypothetical protein [Paenibacillus kobensis]|uniref:hypothetical protein n=1 Tax=Paenibacillus kobensis TaxID=59841 RepID=UPI000FDAD4F4|nr:hypothetical protein [Paenibacillus kobensis]